MVLAFRLPLAVSPLRHPQTQTLLQDQNTNISIPINFKNWPAIFYCTRAKRNRQRRVLLTGSPFSSKFSCSFFLFFLHGERPSVLLFALPSLAEASCKLAASKYHFELPNNNGRYAGDHVCNAMAKLQCRHLGKIAQQAFCG